MEKSKFISKFFKVMAEVTKTSGQITADIFEVWATTPYKGVRMKEPSSSSPYYRGLYNLKNRGLIKVVNGKQIKMTRKGHAWLRSSYLKYCKEACPKWDKKWRVVIFDIPQELHKNRNLFRQKLKYHGFFNLQKSIFVFPYACEKELAEICRKLKILDYVDIIIADSVGFREQEIKKFFDL